MSWFNTDPPIDTSSRRWTVAVHEAAHVIAARKLGWTVAYARIIGNGGETDTRPPRRIERLDYHLQDAVISLAGPRASARMHWFLPDGCQHDERDARNTLRGTGIGYSTAKSHAGRLVNAKWSQIHTIARRLYRDGQL